MVQPEIIGVAGLGTMGLGIAQVFAQAGHRVIGWDASPDARASARDRMGQALATRVAAGKLGQEEALQIAARLTTVAEPEGLAPAMLIVEAVVENLAVKQELLGRVARAAPAAVLATNTSSLPVAAVGAALPEPGRLVGLHFFNPAPAMRLVELVAPEGVAALALALARRLTSAAGKTVIACADRPGFIVNRCARPFYGEALALLEEGRSAGEIDAAMVQAGYRIGPFALIDLIGADINLAATEGLARAMNGHPRYHVFATLLAQVGRGDLGRKSGRGFIFPGEPGPPPADADALVLRIEATLANEAGWLLAEGGISGADIDRAMELGLNFPLGPLRAAARHGAGRILATLAGLESAAPPHLKTRYLPPEGLARAIEQAGAT